MFGAFALVAHVSPYPMFDWTKTISEDLTNDEIGAVRRGGFFASMWDGVQDKFGREQVKDRGMTVSLYPSKGLLIVDGALPTFANGNNLHLLTYPEMQLTIPALAAAVGLPGTRLSLVGMELSNDLDSITSPQPFLQSLQHHKGSKFVGRVPPKGIARPLEYFASHVDFILKYYDKGTWEKRHSNPLPAGQHRTRFEVFLRRARAINALWNRSETTLADLTSLEFYAAAAAQLEQRWKEVVRTQRMDFTGLKKVDEMLLGAGANPEYWRELKARRPLVTYKRTRERYNELVEACAERVGPDAYEQLFAPALKALLPPVAAIENDTFFHTSSLLELPRMLVVEDTAPPLVLVADARAGTGGLLLCPPAYLTANDDDDRPTTAARRCQTCGRALTSGSSRAKFCSEQVWGVAAKKCRNTDSNPRNNAKRSKWYPSPAQYRLFDMVPYSRAAA